MAFSFRVGRRKKNFIPKSRKSVKLNKPIKNGYLEKKLRDDDSLKSITPQGSLSEKELSEQITANSDSMTNTPASNILDRFPDADEDDFQPIPDTRDFEQVYNHSQCNDIENSRDPFLALITPCRHSWDDATGLLGTVSFDVVDGFSLKTQVNFFNEMELSFVSGYSDNLKPLLQLLWREMYPVYVVGDSSRGFFYIKGIHIAGKPQRQHGEKPPSAALQAVQPFYFNDEQFQVMLERLLALDGNPGLLDPNRVWQPIAAKDGLVSLYQICKPCFPKTIQDWVENSLLNFDTPSLGNDDRRHILKALSYVLNIDWTIRSPSIPNLATIKEMLDKRFYGLEKVKERIMEVAAQIRRSKTLPKWGILLHGPAGVGKTSMANAVSEILGLPKASVEFSVIRDSEGLTGSSRVYHNATPGMIIQQLYDHRTANLVMVINEIDKSAPGFDRANPIDILLPLLDGMGFTDTFLGVTVPTSGIFFIATCNDINLISRPVLDRFYRIDIPAYTMEEKRAIFAEYVLPNALQAMKIEPHEVTFTDPAINTLIREYAVQPGIRDLEQFAEKMLSHYLFIQETDGVNSIEFTETDLRKLLGPPIALERNFTTSPGMVFSAFLYDGKLSVISVQAQIKKGSGKLQTVNIESKSQREYCQMAYEAVRSRFHFLSENVDVVLAINLPICESQHNYVGIAVCAAILSAL